MSYITKIIRKEADALKKQGWILLYGRRKTGKTFLLRNLFQSDVYILVKKDRSLWSEALDVSIKDLSLKVRELLDKGKTVVIDEFQRLDSSILEEITMSHPHGKLVLSGSSHRIIHNIFSPKSPLLGFFAPVKLSLLSPHDIIKGLSKTVSFVKAIELSTILRDPWVIPFYAGEKTEPFIYRLVTRFRHTITALIGEIFTEEEREITEKYESILRLLGAGTWKIKDMSSILYSRDIIKSPDSSYISQYMKNLREMGLVENYGLYKSKMKFNRLKSPMMNIYYYLDSRYNISERETSFQEVRPTVKKLLSFEIQNFCADVFRDIYNGRKEYFVSPEKDIDFIITKRNKPVCVGEVKWKRVASKDIRTFKSHVEEFSCDKILIGKTIHVQDPDIVLYDPKKIIMSHDKFISH